MRPVWTMGNGVEVAIDIMSTRHIQNAIDFCKDYIKTINYSVDAMTILESDQGDNPFTVGMLDKCLPDYEADIKRMSGYLQDLEAELAKRVE